MEWNLLLYACFHTQGREYDFDVVDPADVRLGAAVRSIGIRPPAFVAGSFEGRVFFGRRDLVGKALGWDHRIARDASRTLEYLILYTAPGNARLPAWRELAALERRIVADLAHHGNARMKAGVPLERQVAVDLPVFAGPGRAPGAHGGWDASLGELAGGGDRLLLATDAGQSELCELAPERPRLRTDPDKERGYDAELQALIDQKAPASTRLRPILWIAAASTIIAGFATCHLLARDDPGETGELN